MKKKPFVEPLYRLFERIKFKNGTGTIKQLMAGEGLPVEYKVELDGRPSKESSDWIIVQETEIEGILK